MIRKLFIKFNQFHPVDVQFNKVQADLIRHSLENKGIINVLNLFNLYPHKIQLLLTLGCQIRTRHIYSALVMAITYQGIMQKSTIQGIYNKLTKAQEVKIKSNSITSPNLIIKEVLQKQQINDQLSDIITKVNKKQGTIHNITKQLTKLTQIEILYDKTYQLTKDLLITQVLQSKDIEHKLRDIILKVLRDQNDTLVKIIRDVIMSNGANPAREALTNLFNQENFQAALANELQQFMYGYLDERQNANELLKSLQ